MQPDKFREIRSNAIAAEKQKKRCIITAVSTGVAYLLLSFLEGFFSIPKPIIAILHLIIFAIAITVAFKISGANKAIETGKRADRYETLVIALKAYFNHLLPELAQILSNPTSNNILLFLCQVETLKQKDYEIDDNEIDGLTEHIELFEEFDDPRLNLLKRIQAFCDNFKVADFCSVGQIAEPENNVMTGKIAELKLLVGKFNCFDNTN